MGRISGLVPSRFLTLLAHLVIVVIIFWTREDNVLASLPRYYSREDYDSEDLKLVTALSVTLGLFLVELAGFFSGVSMFNSTQSLFCILSAYFSRQGKPGSLPCPPAQVRLRHGSPPPSMLGNVVQVFFSLTPAKLSRPTAARP
ncbi:transmembrane protein 107 isoform X1 [Macrotis lagotis]|uniref:transmembrane protein 107 isoform X1 n=1 Tax=Macrotis lagotis TaxID=92651 RepID=UPI003D68A917